MLRVVPYVNFGLKCTWRNDKNMGLIREARKCPRALSLGEVHYKTRGVWAQVFQRQDIYLSPNGVASAAGGNLFS